MRLREFTPSKKQLNEAIRTVPLTDAQFDELKDRMSKPIPAEVAMILLSDILESDDLSAEFFAASQVKPDSDVRPIIANWLSVNMPSEMHHFKAPSDTDFTKQGLYSTLHGYAPKR